MMSFSNKKFLVALIIAGSIGLVLGVLIPLLVSRNTGLIDPKPKLPPLEKNRIYHPKGFSVIAPDGWLGIIETKEKEEHDRIVINPVTNARWVPKLIIGFNEKGIPYFGPNEYKSVKYLEYDAMICEGILGDYYQWHSFFSYQGDQYSILLMLPSGHGLPRYKEIPDYWYPFLNSLHIQ